MLGTKEIRTKIRSVKNTQKITRAKEMVAASKMRKAQERMASSRPYAKKIRAVIGHLAKAQPEYRHPYLEKRAISRVGFIVVTSDKGLCGGLNVNLFKTVIAAMKHWQQQGVSTELCIVGKKGQAFFKRLGGHVIAQVDHLGDAPSIANLLGIVHAMLDAYDQGQVDAIYLAFNEFANTMTQRPYLEQLLPIVPASEEETLSHHWDYIYEPDARELLNVLLKRYIESQVYQGVIENIACEQAASMLAMKNASDNAGELIHELQLAYNKARQAAITQELAEIVAGAAAV